MQETPIPTCANIVSYPQGNLLTDSLEQTPKSFSMLIMPLANNLIITTIFLSIVTALVLYVLFFKKVTPDEPQAAPIQVVPIQVAPIQVAHLDGNARGITQELDKQLKKIQRQKKRLEREERKFRLEPAWQLKLEIMLRFLERHHLAYDPTNRIHLSKQDMKIISKFKPTRNESQTAGSVRWRVIKAPAAPKRCTVLTIYRPKEPQVINLSPVPSAIRSILEEHKEAVDKWTLNAPYYKKHNLKWYMNHSSNLPQTPLAARRTIRTLQKYQNDFMAIAFEILAFIANENSQSKVYENSFPDHKTLFSPNPMLYNKPLYLDPKLLEAVAELNEID